MATPSAFQVRKRDHLKQTLLEALEQEESRYTILEALVELGASVMLHGRPPEVQEAAETERWVVEIEMFPICVVEEYSGTAMEALREASRRFIIQLEHRFPSPRPGDWT